MSSITEAVDDCIDDKIAEAVKAAETRIISKMDRTISNLQRNGYYPKPLFTSEQARQVAREVERMLLKWNPHDGRDFHVAVMPDYHSVDFYNSPSPIRTVRVSI